ncbi:MAG TPA: hypothetical protein VMV10_09885, partial [Pirellulales bacterium]|nr:hypothetical protein [Pirellulales bacterium]
GKNNAQREVGRLFSPRPISAPTGTERRFCPKAERIHRISLGMARLHPRKRHQEMFDRLLLACLEKEETPFCALT